MKSAQSLKNFIAKNLDGFSENNVIIGSVDLSRFPQKNLCVIVPETMEVVEQYIDGSFEAKTSFTLSFLFRGEKYAALVEKMETRADEIQKLIMNSLSLENAIISAELEKIEFYYDCGTVENQATGLDIKMTITEEK